MNLMNISAINLYTWILQHIKPWVCRPLQSCLLSMVCPRLQFLSLTKCSRIYIPNAWNQYQVKKNPRFLKWNVSSIFTQRDGQERKTSWRFIMVNVYTPHPGLEALGTSSHHLGTLMPASMQKPYRLVWNPTSQKGVSKGIFLIKWTALKSWGINKHRLNNYARYESKISWDRVILITDRY